MDHKYNSVSSCRFVRKPSEQEKLVIKSGKVVRHIPAGRDVIVPEPEIRPHDDETMSAAQWRRRHQISMST